MPFLRQRRRCHLQRLEPRELLALSATFEDGLLQITSDEASDTVVVTSVGGIVKLNGANPLGAPIASSAVSAIEIMADMGADTINLAGVLAADFTSLALVEAYGEGGTDTFTGSELDDLFVAGPDYIDGDVDGNASVDFQDFLALQVGYGITSGASRGDGDLEGDGDVDFQDFLILQAHFGESVPLGTDSLAGGDGNDTLLGNQAANNLTGGDGDDLLDGAGGADTLTGGPGDDTLMYRDALVVLLDGGAGSDTLSIEAAGIELDLTSALTSGQLAHIEAVDLNGAGNNSLVVNRYDVLTLSDTSALTVTGDSGDSVRLHGDWTNLGTVIVDGLPFTHLVDGSANLLIQNTVSVVIEPVIDLITLDGTDGFRVALDAAGNGFVGFDVADAGDINGDGFDDIAIGAPFADPAPGVDTGNSYVVFGAASGFPASLDLADLSGANGFRVQGRVAGGRAGISVNTAGDINGDGYDDLLIGAFRATPAAKTEAGEAYVIFGRASAFPALLDLATLSLPDGFRIEGIDAGDRLGRTISTAGDVNGDGFDDIILGAHYAAPGGDTRAGEAYVIFGRETGYSSILDPATLSGADGFRLDGIDPDDVAGYWVDGAGDVNGDGFDDVVIGAFDAGPPSANNAGETYVVFGHAGPFAASLELTALDGTSGFRLDGVAAGDNSGYRVAGAGDINGDGFDEVLIGAYQADPGGKTKAGQSYVLFGHAGAFSATVALSSLNGANGFRIDGIDPLDASGAAVDGVGDINGDGFDDLLIGAYRASDGPVDSTGESYVLFGKSSAYSAAISLASLNGTNGFRLDGFATFGWSGYSTSAAGDVNGDGFDDFLIGAPRSNSQSGEVFVIFGRDFTGTATDIGTAAPETLAGSAAVDIVIAGGGDDTLEGAGGADVLRGGSGSDRVEIIDLLFARIVGGGGDDVLALTASGLHLDLTALAANRIRGIERIDLGAGGGSNANDLTLDRLDLWDLSDTTNRLIVAGDSSDQIFSNDAWTFVGTTTLASQTYNQYTLGDAELWVDSDIDQDELT